MISSRLPHRKPPVVPGRRSLGFESLEQRELLSVAPLQLPEPEILTPNWFEQMAGREATIPTGDELSGIVENEWVVQLSTEWVTALPSVSAAAEYFDDYGITVIGGLGLEGALHVRVEGADMPGQADLFESLSCFEFWEPNYFIQSPNGVADIVDDAYVDEQWWLDLIDVLPAWEVTKGENVVVAVVDSGVNVTHPDLYPNIWRNPDEIYGNEIDDDGNGFIDDYYGWNFGTTVGRNYDGVGSNELDDTYGHGVHIAGIIAGVENDIGIVGIAPEAKIMPIKTDYYGRMTLSTVSHGISYAIMMKRDYDVNVRVINASFSFYGNMLESQMIKAGEQGIIVVAAAGNEASDNDLGQYYPIQDVFPANNSYLDNVITVAATNETDQLAIFSNYGAEMVNLGAPGNRILSTYNHYDYAWMSGTSMAAPMVSAAVALIASARPELNAAEIKRILCENVDILPQLDGVVQSGGRLNVGRAVRMAVAPENRPATPTGMTVTQRDEDLTFLIEWTDAATNEANYELQISTDGGQSWTTLKKLNADATSEIYTPKELIEYRFRVRCRNHYGDSDWSNTAVIQFVLPDKLPAPHLQRLQGAYSTNRTSLGVVWSSVLGATSYRLERSTSPDGGWVTVFTGSFTPGYECYDDYDVNQTTDYYYRVFTVHGDVESDPSNISTTVRPPAPTASPTPSVLRTGADTVELIFDAIPESDSYLIQRYNATTKQWDDLKAVSTGYYLDNRGLKSSTTYRYRIRAANNGGFAPFSTEVQATTLGPLPAAATNVKFLIRDWFTTDITWKAAKGALAYRVERRDGNDLDNWITVPLSNATATGGTITGLIPDDIYMFRVVSINESGEAATNGSVLSLLYLMAPYESPSGLTLLERGETSIRFQWNTVYSEVPISYVVERSTDQKTWRKVWSNYVVLTEFQEPTTEYTDTRLLAGTQYYYRVYATVDRGYDVRTFPSEVLAASTVLTTKFAPTVKVATKNITITGAEGLTITPPKNAPTGLYYYIEYTSAVDSKKKPDWSQSVIERVSGTTHDLQTQLTPNTQYHVRVVAMETDYALDSLPAWSALESVGIGKVMKFKTKAVPLAKITASGYAISSDGEFGVKLRMTTPAQNDNKKTPVLPDGTTFSYQVIVADPKAKVAKTTGLLIGGVDLGTISFTETSIKGKTYFDSSIISFGDIVRIGDLTKMKSVQIQLLVTYTDSAANTHIAAVATKVAKITLPKWFA